MDQVKIGKFIAEQRKEKKLTQTQLAEKLGITDRAISKWENGKAMPDSSIMIELSDLLGISVNELLQGEKIKQENYHKIAEENLVKMQQNAESVQKKAKILQTVFTTLCLFLSLLIICVLFVHMGMNYIFPDTYDGALFEAIGPLSMILTFVFVATSAILKFQEEYEITIKGEEENEKIQVVIQGGKKNQIIQKLEIVFKGICIAFSIVIMFFLSVDKFLDIFYRDIVFYEEMWLSTTAGVLAIWNVIFFWGYSMLANFNRSYTIHKK